MAKPTLFLIDGSNQMYRAYHAIRGLTGPDGRSTNAIYGFVTMLRKLIADHNPECIAAAFDLRGPTFRSELRDDYKANRAPMPSDLAEQIGFVHQACEALGVQVLTYAGFEADDVIGTLAMRAVADGRPAVIVTGDKDFFQLVDDDKGIRVFNPRDEGAWYNAQAVKTKFGVAPEQVVDVLALMGDSIDNIKGVPGIGEKGARELISTHGSLDALLENAPTLSGKKRELLTTHADSARESRVLLRIRTDVPLPSVDMSCFDYRGPNRQKCFELFSTLGFRSLVTEFAPTADTVDADYKVINTEEGLASLVAELQGAGRFALSVIGDCPGAMRASLVGIAFSTAARRAWYLPIGHTALDEPSAISGRSALAALKGVLENPSIAKIGHDLKFDLMMLSHEGIELKGFDFDTMLASYVLDATRSSHTIEEIALEYLGYKALTEDDICGTGQKAIALPHLPAAALLSFAGERSDLAWQLEEKLGAKLRENGLESLFRDLELPLVPVLAKIERYGVRIDLPALASQSQRIDADLAARSARIFELAGEEFNINSPKQLSAILFVKLELPTAKRTGKTRVASTAVDVLEELALTNELPKLILEWRALMKLKGTYIDALPQLVHSRTARVHTSFNQAVAATGRLSSSNPNLQNIPVRTELGRQIRRAFIPGDAGQVLLAADYSQIELRILAHLSGDEGLREAFASGHDIHTATSARVFGIPEDKVDPALRSRAKMINYGLAYGLSAWGLASRLDIAPDEAQEIMDAYFESFPGIREYLDRQVDRATVDGYTETLLGRRRYIPELHAANPRVRDLGRRQALNAPIQGSASDVFKVAMIDVDRALREHPELDCHMLLTVHDELVFEVAEAHVEEAAALVKERMESAVELDVALRADIGWGANWAEAAPEGH